LAPYLGRQDAIFIIKINGKHVPKISAKLI